IVGIFPRGSSPRGGVGTLRRQDLSAAAGNFWPVKAGRRALRLALGMRARAVFFALGLVGCGSAEDGASSAEGDAATSTPADGSTDAGAAPSSDATTASTDAGSSDATVTADSGCPAEMARIAAFCVDRYEAFVVEIDD